MKDKRLKDIIFEINPLSKPRYSIQKSLKAEQLVEGTRYHEINNLSRYFMFNRFKNIDHQSYSLSSDGDRNDTSIFLQTQLTIVYCIWRNAVN